MTCEACKGAGKIQQRNMWLEWEDQECLVCDGTGKIIEHEIEKDDDEDDTEKV